MDILSLRLFVDVVFQQLFLFSLLHCYNMFEFSCEVYSRVQGPCFVIRFLTVLDEVCLFFIVVSTYLDEGNDYEYFAKGQISMIE